jgi:hypothetical protein
MRKPLTLFAAAACAAAAGIGLGAAPAVASPAAAADTTITVTYPVTGTTLIKAINSTLSLGPGTLTSTADLTNSTLTGTLSLPAATGSFKELGFIPVSATTQLIQDGPATGTVDFSTNTVTTTAETTIELTSLKVFGISLPLGNSCETATPTAITVTSQTGFNVLSGGTLAGTYTIPRFTHCGLATFLINLTLPGPGNTISLTLGAAKL